MNYRRTLKLQPPLKLSSCGMISGREWADKKSLAAFAQQLRYSCDDSLQAKVDFPVFIRQTTLIPDSLSNSGLLWAGECRHVLVDWNYAFFILDVPTCSGTRRHLSGAGTTQPQAGTDLAKPDKIYSAAFFKTILLKKFYFCIWLCFEISENRKLWIGNNDCTLF